MAHILFHLALLSWELHPLIEQGAHLPFKGWCFSALQNPATSALQK